VKLSDKWFGWLFWSAVAAGFAYLFFGPMQGRPLGYIAMAVVAYFLAACALFTLIAALLGMCGLSLQGAWYVVTAVREKMRRDSPTARR
jgi:hypothetical protein